MKLNQSFPEYFILHNPNNYLFRWFFSQTINFRFQFELKRKKNFQFVHSIKQTMQTKVFITLYSERNLLSTARLLQFKWTAWNFLIIQCFHFFLLLDVAQCFKEVIVGSYGVVIDARAAQKVFSFSLPCTWYDRVNSSNDATTMLIYGHWRDKLREIHCASDDERIET